MSKLLIVDDDDGILKTLRQFLVHQGHDVITASSGEEALEKLQEEPTVVLLDYMMPEMNGVKVLERIKEISPSTDVIMVTGFGAHDIAKESFKRGAFEFVTKPVNLDRLESLLNPQIEQLGQA
jgi:DNA-binding NtrC family response regulator